MSFDWRGCLLVCQDVRLTAALSRWTQSLLFHNLPPIVSDFFEELWRPLVGALTALPAPSHLLQLRCLHQAVQPLQPSAAMHARAASRAISGPCKLHKPTIAQAGVRKPVEQLFWLLDSVADLDTAQYQAADRRLCLCVGRSWSVAGGWVHDCLHRYHRPSEVQISQQKPCLR